MLTVQDTQYNGQALQDKFVLSVLKHKRNGTFLELGGNHPCIISNTYLLESKYDWKGIMVEYDEQFKDMYSDWRPNSKHVFQDATTVDYVSLLSDLTTSTAIDYLQIDLEPGNGSTLTALKNLDANVFDTYKFATVTFEHDIYSVSEMFQQTRNESRAIFEKRGYVRVFSDINNDGWHDTDSIRKHVKEGGKYAYPNYAGTYPFEDWYVHPDLVDMTYVSEIMNKNRDKYVENPVCGSTINFTELEYSEVPI